MELVIYDREGNFKKKVSPDSSSRWSEEVASEFVVSVNFTTWEFFVLSVGDYIEVGGKRFSVKKEYRPKKTNTQKYTYNISFYGREHDMQDLLFCRLNQGSDDLESVFAYDGTPMEYLQKLVDNMNRNTDGVTWRVGEAITANRQTINFNGLYCWDAAAEIAQAFETEWWLDGEYLNLSKCERGERVTLGYMKGLKTGLTQSENSDSIKWFTRLIPVGSTKNIDPSKYGFTHLQLPSRATYIDLNTQLGLKEHREESAFSDIFPHRLGTVSSVRSEEKTNEETGDYTVYYVKDNELPFNPDDYMISGKVILITFESGDLEGREFECNWHNDTKEFEIINTYPDEDTQIPGGNLIPKAGDTYILTNIRMPDEYYPIAEQQFEQAVENYLKEYSRDISIYSSDTDYIYVDKNEIPLLLGQRVKLEDEQYFAEGYLDTRITRVERKLTNLSEASVSCSAAVSSSWKSSIESSLDNLQYVLASQTEKTSLFDIIKVGDGKQPSDYNVFSALKSLSTLLRKDQADSTNFLVRFLGGLEVGKAIDSLIAGSGIIMDKNGRIQASSLELRNSLTVLELIFNRLSAQEGDYSYSESGLIESIEELSEGTYRLLLRKRHDTDFNAFAVNDIIYGSVNDLLAGGGSYRTSWMRVIETNTTDNYIDVVMYPDSEVPGGKNYPPEELMAITRRGNTTDEDRQGYWYISSYEKCICMLDGVTKPILEESNYSILIGKMKNLSIFDNLPINYRQSYIYCRGLIRQDDIRVDVEGKPVYELVDRGIWQEGEKYYFEARNEVTGRNEISTVYHRGSKWQCLKTGTLLEPKWNSTDWAFLEGNGEFSIDFESSNGFSFFYGLIDTVIEAKFYHGTVDITEDVMNTAGTQITWSRDSGIPAEDNSWSPVFVDGQKNKVHLISSDMGSEWLNTRSVTFRVEAIIPLGEENYLRESEELSFNL